MLYVHPYIFQKDNLRFLFKTFIQNKNLVTMKTRHVFLLNIIRNLSEGNLIKFIQNIKKPLYLLTINLRFLGQKKSYNKLNS